MLSTNFPVYLCKYWEFMKGSRFEISMGSTDSVTSDDTQNFRRLITELDPDWGTQKWEDLKNIDESERASHLCTILDNRWDIRCPIKSDIHTGAVWTDRQELVKADQQVRLIGVNQGSDVMNHFYGTSKVFDSSLISLKNDKLKYMALGLVASRGQIFEIAHYPLFKNLFKRRARSLERKPLNDQTRSDEISKRRLKCPRGVTMPEDAIKLLALDNDLRQEIQTDLGDKDDIPASKQSTVLVGRLDSCKVSTAVRQKKCVASFNVTMLHEPKTEPLYFMATDTTMKEPGKHAKRLAKKDTDLDLFLGSLRTGALVLSQSPINETVFVPLDETDELCQFFFDAIGDRNADGSHGKLSAMEIKISIDNVLAVRFPTALQSAFPKGKAVDKPFFKSKLVFSSENNADAFAMGDQKLWPAVTDSPDDANIVGPGQVLCMSIGKSPSFSDLTISGDDLLKFLEIPPSTIIDLLLKVSSLTLDNSIGSRNALWFVPDRGNFKVTLRLSFTSSSLISEILSRIKEMLSIPKSGVDFKLMNCTVVAKKTWSSTSLLRNEKKTARDNEEPAPEQKQSDDSLAVLSTSLITVSDGQNPPQSVTLGTAMVFDETSTSWTLIFDPNKNFKDMLNFIAKVVTTSIDYDPGSFLPDLGLDKIKLCRATYQSGPADEKHIILDFQVAFTSMGLYCQIDLGIAPKKSVDFAGKLLLPAVDNDRLDVASFGRYMPEVEEWQLIQLTPGTAPKKGTASLEDLYQSLTKSTSSANGVTLDKGPIIPELIGLSFSLSDGRVSFDATIATCKPSDAKMPVLRLGTASLSLKYNQKAVENKVEEFAISTTVYLESFVVGERASMNVALTYTTQEPKMNIFWKDGDSLPSPANFTVAEQPARWILSGSVLQMKGSALYSLFDSDCNLEMMQLLQHVSLSLSLRYIYEAGGGGSSFTANGTLVLGSYGFDFIYLHNGNSPPSGQPRWKFEATASTAENGGTLAGVIASICGPDVMAKLPACVQNIAASKSGSKNLGAFSLFNTDEWIILLLRITLADGASVAFYQLQKKRKPAQAEKAQADKALPVKRLFVFSLTSLPSVKNIPVVGDLKQPFDEMMFCYVGGSEAGQGYTREESKVLEKYTTESFIKVPYKDNYNSPKDADVLLEDGSHLMVNNDHKPIIDLAFGGAKAQTANNQEESPKPDKPASAPLSKRIGPVTISALGVDFDIKTQTLSLVVSGSVKAGPLDLALSGFKVNFHLDGDGITFRNILNANISFDLDGLGVAFEKAPLVLAGFLEHTVTPDVETFEGGATVGFQPWIFQAGGYYAIQKKKAQANEQDEQFKCFLAFAKLSGPIATIGYAEIRDVTGGFGYNTTITFPTVDRIPQFPLLADSTPGEASKAIVGLRQSGWFANKEGSNWVAFGMTVLAFEMLTVSAVIVVEWDSNVKLGIFALATAEMPKKLPNKFALVQLGISATIDFGAGTMKIDGQLTPASYVIDPNCRLSGGFAMYSWFGEGNANQGDWIFTLGGYHPMYQAPPQYPNPPRLAINWHYDDNISIRGEAYFAITPKTCMGGGRLEVTLSVGNLYAYFRAFADFLINYKPFRYMADGGVAVGVQYTLDLWLVSVPISIELSATLHIEGPPMVGRVHVNFWVFGFDVNFGKPQNDEPPKASLQEFFDMVVQTPSQKPAGVVTNEKSKKPAPHVFTCTSGLMPPNTETDGTWVVRGAVFAFSIACKFALNEASLVTAFADTTPPHPIPITIDPKYFEMYAKPMLSTSVIKKSKLTLTICPDGKCPATPIWTEDVHTLWEKADLQISKLPKALWGRYDENEDPSRPSAKPKDLLDGTKNAMVALVTGLTVYAPEPQRSKDQIKPFNVEAAMRKEAGETELTVPEKGQGAWAPDKTVGDGQYELVKKTWEAGEAAIKEAVDFWSGLAVFAWEESALKREFPGEMVGGMERLWTGPPAVSVGGVGPRT